MPHLSDDLMPPCTMKRVIVHWTAGAHRASDLDRAHYHLLIEADGRIVKGACSIDCNAARVEPRASHTRNCNTGSIGVAVCAMAGARERPFTAGPFAMTQRQWSVMAEVVTELCRRYSIPVTTQTVLAHGEVERHLGIPQRQKWDPMVLPWAPALPKAEVMEGFRAQVRRLLTQATPLSAVPPAAVAAADRTTDAERSLRAV